MKIVLLTGEGCEHAYVANRLLKDIPIAAIFIDRGKKQTGLARLKVLYRRYTYGQMVSRLIGKIMAVFLRDGKRQQNEINRILGKENCILHTDAPVKYVNGINTPESIASIRELKPDIILIYGTGIIGKTILKMPPLGAYNMHTGMSPHYRGTGCAFWPLYNNDPGMIGATVHECTPEVDGGKIFSVRHADLDANDNLFSMFPRSVKLGADMYAEVMGELVLNGKLDGMAQDLSVGKEYRAAMKSWWKELIVRVRIRRGLIRDYVIRGDVGPKRNNIH